ncbi:MAG: putative N-acetylmannosamine-6-phosphate 2-epimerase [Chloroflexi bacterium]|nr:putative N-acetylmannosamine-6-phosphate 2-epimerase [Chloroflexota bacterium]
MAGFDSFIPPRSIIVSCQAETGTPTDDVGMITAFAKSAAMGGAAGLRLAGAEHIKAVRAVSDLPIIGIHKDYRPDALVLITGDSRYVAPLVSAGAQIVAFDATRRERPSTLTEIVDAIHAAGALALADLRQTDDIDAALSAGADALATTLSVWDLPDYVPDIAFIEGIARRWSGPIIAEGNFWSPEDVRRALDTGAHAVVIGSAITRPWKITEYYVRAAKR